MTQFSRKRIQLQAMRIAAELERKVLSETGDPAVAQAARQAEYWRVYKLLFRKAWEQKRKKKEAAFSFGF